MILLAVSSSLEAGIRVLAQLAADPKDFYSGVLALPILKAIAKCRPLETLQNLPRWLPEASSVRLREPQEWGELISTCAQRSKRRGQDLWLSAIDLAIELVRLDPLAASQIFGRMKLPKDLMPSNEQLQSLFGLVGLGSMGDLLQSLRRGKGDEPLLDEALCQALSHRKDISSVSISSPNLVNWTPLARKQVAKRLSAQKPLEVAGGPACEEPMHWLIGLMIESCWRLNKNHSFWTILVISPLNMKH